MDFMIQRINTKWKSFKCIEEERFTGIKHDFSFPINSINWILKQNNISSKDISTVCYYENPKLKHDRDWKSYWKYFWKNPFKFPKRLNHHDELEQIFHFKVIYNNHHYHTYHIHTLPQTLKNQLYYR